MSARSRFNRNELKCVLHQRLPGLMDIDVLPPSQLPLFYGISGQECEQFVQTMWAVGTAAGKSSDSDWMLALATSSFTGYAAEWFERRDRPAEEGWRELARSLFDHWPSNTSVNRLEADDVQTREQAR